MPSCARRESEDDGERMVEWLRPANRHVKCGSLWKVLEELEERKHPHFADWIELAVLAD